MPEPLPLPYETPLDLSDPNRWTLRLSTTLTAESAGGGKYWPIDEYQPTTTFNSPILLIQTINSQGINYMGKLSQWQSMGIGGGTITRLGRRSIYKGSQLVRFRQDLLGDYTIRFLPGQWVNQLSLLIYEFL